MNKYAQILLMLTVVIISALGVPALQKIPDGYTNVVKANLIVDRPVIMAVGNSQDIPVTFAVSLGLDIDRKYLKDDSVVPQSVDLLRIDHWRYNTNNEIISSELNDAWIGYNYFSINRITLKGSVQTFELNQIANATREDYTKVDGIIPNTVGNYFYIARTNIPDNHGGTRFLYSNIVLVQVTNAPVPYEQSATPTDGGLNLATGEEEREFGPDMVVENPSGPSASISRTYSSARAKLDYGSPGLPKGWVLDSDIKIVPAKTKPFMNDDLIIEFPNGSKEMWLVEPNISGTPEVTPPVKAPYTVKGTLDDADSPQWSSFVLTMRDHSSWTFTRFGSGDTLAYRLTTVTDANGQAINYDLETSPTPAQNGRLKAIKTTDGANTISLINCTYAGNNLMSISDEFFYETPDEKTKYARKVNYAYDGDGQLSTVSWVHNAADNISYKHYQFGYQTIIPTNMKLLNSVQTFALPVGQNQVELSTEGIERDDRKRITKYTDPYGNTRTYEYTNRITAADIANKALLKDADIDDFATIVRAFAAGNALVAVGEWVYFYDENAHGKGAQEANNERTRITLNTDPNFSSKPIKVQGTDGTGLVFTYTPTGEVETMTDSYGVETIYAYDYNIDTNPDSLLSSVVQLVGNKYYFRKAYTYDYEYGQLVTSITAPAPGTQISYATKEAAQASNDVVTTTIYYDYDDDYCEFPLGNVTDIYETGKNYGEEIVTRFNYTDDTQTIARYGKPTSVVTSVFNYITYEETELSWSSCEYAQNRYNQVSKLINPLGYATNVSINPHGIVESVTDHYNKTVSMKYDNAFDQLLETQLPIVGANPNALSAKKVYTPKYLGGPTKTQQIYDEGETTAFRTLSNNYGKVGELLSSSNGNAAQDMTYTYDALYRLKTVKQGNLPITQYEYNPATAIAGPNTKVTASDGTVAISYYKKNGQLDYVTQAGATISYEYYPKGDANDGQLKQVTYPNEDSVVYGYDTFGRSTSVTETIHTLKDNVATTDIETTTTVYDNSGYVTKVTDHTGKISTMTYDLQGRLIATTVTTIKEDNTVDEKVSKTIYDEVNLTVLNTSQDGSGTRKTFDKLGRTLKLELGTVEANDVFTPTTTTEYTPNDTDRKMVVSYPGGETNTLEYDAWQRLKASTDAKGVKKEYQYKHLGLLTNINYPAALTAYNVTNQYDSLDRLQTITDFSGKRTYSYYGNGVTGAGRLQKVATRFRDPAQNLLPEQATQDITYSYTDSGKRHTMGTPTRTYTYGYDTYGRWNSITNAQTGTTTCTLRWDGRVTQQQLGNGATTEYTWTVLQGRLVKQTNTRSDNGQPVQTKFTNFVYDWKHQLTSYSVEIDNVLKNISFTYDEKTGELLKDANTDTKAYKYDQRGNILHQPNHELNGYIDTDRFTRAYNQKNQWIGYTDKQDDDQVVYNRKDNSLTGDPLFAYDANGNPTTYKGIGASYDPDNNLTGYGDMLTAGYRSDGLRAWKQNADGVRTYFLYDGDKLVCELKLTGTAGNYNLAVSASTTWGPNGLADRYVNATATKVYYQCDPLGNVIQRLDENNNVISISSYDSYGNTNITAMGGDPFGYKGKFGYYTDVETGLILCQHRYYDPATGRWLTRDPIGYAGGLNLYAYCGNEPVGGVDPSGFIDGYLPQPSLFGDNAPLGQNNALLPWKYSAIRDINGNVQVSAASPINPLERYQLRYPQPGDGLNLHNYKWILVSPNSFAVSGIVYGYGPDSPVSKELDKAVAAVLPSALPVTPVATAPVSTSFIVPKMKSKEERYLECFPDTNGKPPTDQYEMSKHIVRTKPLKIWTYDNNHVKVEGSITLKVLDVLSPKVEAAFEEIFNSPDDKSQII